VLITLIAEEDDPDAVEYKRDTCEYYDHREILK
jgi:hypothetical protein